MAGMSTGVAAMSRLMMFLPASPGIAELPTCSAGVAGQLVASSAIRRMAHLRGLRVGPWTWTGTRW
jgi:hypothetical protein